MGEFRVVKSLFHSLKLLLLDMASTILFLFLYLWTESIPVAVLAGMMLGILQIGWELWRKKPIEVMQWMSLFLILGSGSISLLTNDPRIVLIKPSLIYLIVCIVMLKPGWMTRYLPPRAQELVPDVAMIFGYVWAGLMFFTAVMNVLVAWNFSVAVWASFMAGFALISKLGLFAIQFLTMRILAGQRVRAQARAEDTLAVHGGGAQVPPGVGHAAD
jgi:intracellular septation protein